jgi:superfamily II DNA/RNA helicase
MRVTVNFADLGLPTELVSALNEQGLTEPTPVQAAVIPDGLAGKDVLGRARTGSGKTLAFGLSLLARLAVTKSQPKLPHALVLLPTRELATQVSDVLTPLAHTLGLRVVTVYGGVPINRQINALKKPADIIVATPGRLGDLLERNLLKLSAIKITVLDEADHLCDLGFYKPVDALLAATPAGSQKLLLSATLDGDVNKLVRRHLPQHTLHELDDLAGKPAQMEHHVLVTPADGRIDAVHALTSANPRTIVFTRTRRGASRLARQLTTRGVESVDLHGDLDQRRRERNLAKFTSGEAQVIVATDVAARGIHVDGLAMVVHFDAPAEHKAYLHRSGRTARAGEKGTVVTLATHETLGDIVRLQHKAGVTSRHHNASSAPQPLTADSLSGAGEPAPKSVQSQRKPANQQRNRRSRPSGHRSRRPSNSSAR